MIGRIVPCLAALVLPAALAADPATVAPCEGNFVSSASNLWIPASESVRTFANGNVRLLWLDTSEPACCSSHLMVVLPSPDDPGDLCRLVSADAHLGFGGMNLPGAAASYDPARGLSVSIPVNIWSGDAPRPKTLTVTINQGTGSVTAHTSP